MTATATATAEMPAPVPKRLRSDGSVMRVLRDELGKCEAYGPLAIWTLITADSLEDVLYEDYFAVSHARGMKADDWLLATVGVGTENRMKVIMDISLATGGLDTARESSGPKKVHVSLLSAMKVPVPVPPKSKGDA